MKPIIIIKETNKDGKFELTEKELKELIEKAYEQGFEEGRPKATLPQSKYDRPEEGILHRNINDGESYKLQTLPYVISNPMPNCGGITTSDPNRATLPCWLNQTSGQPNPTTKLNGSAVSTGV